LGNIITSVLYLRLHSYLAGRGHLTLSLLEKKNQLIITFIFVESMYKGINRSGSNHFLAFRD